MVVFVTRHYASFRFLDILIYTLALKSRVCDIEMLAFGG